MCDDDRADVAVPAVQVAGAQDAVPPRCVLVCFGTSTELNELRDGSERHLLLMDTRPPEPEDQGLECDGVEGKPD